MSPLPEDNTIRIQVTYTSGGKPHTAELRLPAGTAKATGETQAQELGDAMAQCMASGDSTLNAYWIPAGTNIRQVLTFIPAAGAGAAGTITPESQAVFFSFTGRSDDGRDTRFTLFTILFDGQTVYRILVSAASSVVQDLFAVVAANDNAPVTISGEEAHWNNYVNIGQNSHFQRKSRT